MEKDYTALFLANKSESHCPRCGKWCDPIGSDEGPTGDHWFERYYYCNKCQSEFTECFDMIPTALVYEKET